MLKDAFLLTFILFYFRPADGSRIDITVMAMSSQNRHNTRSRCLYSVQTHTDHSCAPLILRPIGPHQTILPLCETTLPLLLLLLLYESLVMTTVLYSAELWPLTVKHYEYVL